MATKSLPQHGGTEKSVGRRPESHPTAIWNSSRQFVPIRSTHPVKAGGDDAIQDS